MCEVMAPPQELTNGLLSTITYQNLSDKDGFFGNFIRVAVKDENDNALLYNILERIDKRYLLVLWLLYMHS